MGWFIYNPLTTGLLRRRDFEKRVVIECMNNVGTIGKDANAGKAVFGPQ